MSGLLSLLLHAFGWSTSDLPYLLVAFPCIVAGAVMLVGLSRWGRRKGYRGPFPLVWLLTVCLVVFIGGATVLSTLGPTDIALPAAFAGLTAAALACCTVVVALLPRRVERVPGVRHPRFPFRALAVVVAGSAPVGVLTLLVGGQFRYGFDAALFGVLSTALLVKMADRARAGQVSSAEGLDADGSAVLLLRGFRDEQVAFSLTDTHRARRGVARLWHALLLGVLPEDSAQSVESYLGPAIAERFGPLIGLGNPVDYLPPAGGMSRYYAPDQEWQAEFARLVPLVRAILVLAGPSTSSLSWELEHLRGAGARSRTFLLTSRFIPPGEPGSWRWAWFWFVCRLRGGRPMRWPRLASDMAKLGWELPPAYPGPASVLCFDDAGRGRVLVRDAESAVALSDAVARGLSGQHKPGDAPAARRRDPTATPSPP